MQGQKLKKAACCIAAISAALVMQMAVFAASASGTIKVTPKEVETGKVFPERSIAMCEVFKDGETGYEPAESFRESGMDTEKFLGEDPNEYAWQILKYVRENGLPSSHRAVTGSDGCAAFSQVESGIYLVYEEKDLFSPFFIQVKDCMEACEPKVEKNSPAPPETIPPVDTGDKGASLPAAVMAVSAAGAAAAVCIKKKNKANKQ